MKKALFYLVLAFSGFLALCLFNAILLVLLAGYPGYSVKLAAVLAIAGAIVGVAYRNFVINGGQV